MFPGHSVESSGEDGQVKCFGRHIVVIAVLIALAGACRPAPLPPGRVVKDTVVGQGTAVDAGKLVTVHYVGRFADGKDFDESHMDGQPPLLFLHGVTRPLPGWAQGVAGMRPGGQRIVTIPPSLAYGTDGVRGAIPPSA